MNIKKIKYKMSKEDSWKIGYIIGQYDGDLRTLLDSDFNYVPKIVEGDREWTVYDLMSCEETLNITIPI